MVNYLEIVIYRKINEIYIILIFIMENRIYKLKYNENSIKT